MDYINEEDICRSAYLLEYFGQSDASDCGTCDVCRKARRNPAPVQAGENELISFINDEMNGCYSLDDVSRRFGSPASGIPEAYLSILRRMIDEGKVPAPSH